MIRTLKLILILFLFNGQTSFGQIINPSYSSKEVDFCDIVKIEKTNSNTTIYFKCTSPPAIGRAWICAGSAFFIRDCETKSKYKLIKANNIPFCPEHHYFAYTGKTLEFNLVFETLPSSTTKIDIIEDEIKFGFNFFGVNLSTTITTTTPTYKTLDMDGKLRKTQDAFEYFALIPAGQQVKIISGPVTGMYFIDYNGVQGYLNELYFSTPKNNPTPKLNPNQKIEKETNKLVSEADFKSYISQNIQNFTPIVGIYKIRASMSIYIDGALYDQRNVEYNHNEDKAAIINDGNSHFQLVINQYNNAESTKMRIESNANYNEFFLENSLGENNRFTLNDRGNFEFTKQITWEKYCDIFGLQKNNPQRYRLKAFKNIEYTKMFPSEIEVQKFGTSKLPETRKSSGSGFGISSDGIIITCFHVVDGAKSIKVRGIDGNFDKGYSAKVLISDKNNDLSIIKIDDLSFSNIESIPYVIRSSTVNVGENIFVLGYPLRSTMGDEIKLTNGIVSSKSGFQGDVTSYQISAPIQPGNSGGSLFDEKGNVIGIINAKHIGAENASYAIKTAYLLNLIDLLPTPPKLQAISAVSGKPLTEQIKVLKNFIYIIEIN